MLCTGPRGWKNESCGIAAPIEIVDALTTTETNPVPEIEDVAGADSNTDPFDMPPDIAPPKEYDMDWSATVLLEDWPTVFP